MRRLSRPNGVTHRRRDSLRLMGAGQIQPSSTSLRMPEFLRAVNPGDLPSNSVVSNRPPLYRGRIDLGSTASSFLTPIYRERSAETPLSVATARRISIITEFRSTLSNDHNTSGYISAARNTSRVGVSHNPGAPPTFPRPVSSALMTATLAHGRLAHLGMARGLRGSSRRNRFGRSPPRSEAYERPRSISLLRRRRRLATKVRCLLEFLLNPARARSGLCRIAKDNVLCWRNARLRARQSVVKRTSASLWSISQPR